MKVWKSLSLPNLVLLFLLPLCDQLTFILRNKYKSYLQVTTSIMWHICVCVQSCYWDKVQSECACRVRLFYMANTWWKLLFTDKLALCWRANAALSRLMSNCLHHVIHTTVCVTQACMNTGLYKRPRGFPCGALKLKLNKSVLSLQAKNCSFSALQRGGCTGLTSRWEDACRCRGWRRDPPSDWQSAESRRINAGSVRQRKSGHCCSKTRTHFLFPPCSRSKEERKKTSGKQDL